MKIHEYQARQILKDSGVPVPDAIACDTPSAVADAFNQLQQNGASIAVVKAQVHAGGRGKGGGVKLVKSADDAQQAAETMMSKNLVTHQTGPEGVPVNKVLVAAGVEIDKEFYLSITLDRATSRPVMIASAEGGVDIETVAAETPEKIIRRHIHPLMGLQGHEARSVAFKLGFVGKQVSQAAAIMMKLARLFVAKDADMVEINPLITTKPSENFPDGQVMAIDSKVTFDNNALFRHKDIQALFDPAEEDPAELEANKFGLSYIKLDGTIGCLVNGAGLAMSTMDIIKLHGGEPANFLDVGGSASEEAIAEAFKIILSDPNVKGVLVNIFGGIMQCDKIARGIVGAAKTIGFKVPLVVRLEGTNVEPAREIIEAAKTDIPVMQVATDLTDAAQKITAAVN